MTATPIPRVVLGVAGGIAAYKAAEVLRGLTESGCDVTVVPTRAALKFVGEPTWAALSGHPIATEVWSDAHDVPHVRLGQQADCVVVAPATADLIARATHGLASDLLTNVLLTARCPVILAPAMHTEMWQHPATVRNVAILRERGITVLDPAVGRLTGADSGPGRLPEPAAIVQAVLAALRRGGPSSADLGGVRILVSAGGTREAWDPVRFLGNASSGRQGVELARTALARGASVTLVAAHMDVDAPAGAHVVSVDSAENLREAMHAETPGADVVVMAAAVADFRPADVGATKIKKDADNSSIPTLRLERTADVLREIVDKRGTASRPLVVGFAAETGEPGRSVIDLGREKLAHKGCDLLVLNDVSDGQVFGRPDNAVVILGSDGTEVAVPRADKGHIADAIWDAVAIRLGRA